ncbi:TP53-regulating kinase [Strongyloides ratti]|uniref:non-specific serine/threonine protein kinase n=1 Tax=Strongyloides ratti TaxID=34506 RepID=A0A090MX91_STRRB|nr:TP53-regulating kinase [Strongyloides ratti]CEF65024.1 TP53-regulating kinase [Strongyloides ratti]
MFVDRNIKNPNDEEFCCESVPFKQGAEARLYHCKYNENKSILKERFKKTYRHETLDKKLIVERRKAEVKGINRCKDLGISVPEIYYVNEPSNFIIMEDLTEKTMVMKTYIENLRENLFNDITKFEGILKDLSKKLGIILGKMHEKNIIHGDLTTSNLLVSNIDINNELFTLEGIYIIDFGLTFMDKNSAENKAVDLYVMERALKSTHHKLEFFFDSLLDGYKSYNAEFGKKVLTKLDEIRLRGRKRDMTG